MSIHFQDCFWVENGFDALKSHMKTGTELCKDLEALLADRADLEKEYANGIHKILKKARKSTKHALGSVEEVWSKIIESLEMEEENHRKLFVSFSQEGSKVMKAFVETQVKASQPAIAAVEKGHKQYTEKYTKQLRNKRVAFKSCRDLESSWEQLKDMKGGHSAKPVSEKDVAKMERSCRKMEDGLVKADREYRDSNMKTEEARLAWEAAMYKCCNTLECLEYDRIVQVQAMINKYCEDLQTIIPPIETACGAMIDSSNMITPEGDVETACTNIGTGPNQPEQLLLDYYEEGFNNHMNSDRRRKSLEKKIQHMEEDIDRQQRSKAGVEQLAKVYQEQPDFTDEKGAEDVTRQLVEADCILNMLKANHFKLLCAHAEISNAPRPSSHFSDYISSVNDKHNTPVSTLRIPCDQISDVQVNYEPPKISSARASVKRGNSLAQASYNGADNYGDDYEVTATGGTLEFDDTPDDQVDDEFQDGDGEYNYVGTCQALYDYPANQDDELTLQPGDVINIIEKYDKDWWQGELNGQVGIFPCSYVEDM